MKKFTLIIMLLLVLTFQVACGKIWTEESARQEAFKNVKYKIDTTRFPSQDPDYQENQKALEKGEIFIEDRGVTPNSEPPVSYVVSKLDENKRQKITMFYDKNGELLAIRLFSNIDFPKAAYYYCIKEGCPASEKNIIKEI